MDSLLKESLTEDRLYLDTARIGQISSGAASACRAVTAMADENPRRVFDEVIGSNDTDGSDIPHWRGLTGFRRSMLDCFSGGSDRRVLMASHSTAILKLAAQAIFLTSDSVFCTDLIWPRYKSMLSTEAQRWAKRLTVMPLRGSLSIAKPLDLVAKVAKAFLESQSQALFLTGVSSDGFKLPIEQIVECIKSEREVRFVAVDGSQEFAQSDHSSSSRVADIYLFSGHKWLGGYHPLAFCLYGKTRSRDFLETLVARMIESGAIEDPLLRFLNNCHSDDSEDFQETVNILPLLAASGAVNDLLAKREDSLEIQSMNTRNREIISDLVSQTKWTAMNDVPDKTLYTQILTLRHPSGRRWPIKAVTSLMHAKSIVCSCYDTGDIRLSLPKRELNSSEITRIGDCLDC